jgi:hypothetical protein
LGYRLLSKGSCEGLLRASVVCTDTVPALLSEAVMPGRIGALLAKIL